VVRRRQHHRVAQRAAEPRLVAVRQRVAADVEEHDQVRLHRGDRRRNALGQPGGAQVHVNENRLNAEQTGHPRFREQNVAAADLGVGSRCQHTRRDLGGVLDLLGAPGARHRVDRPALPRDTADDRVGAVIQAAVLGGRERADDVTAAADPQYERPLGRDQLTHNASSAAGSGRQPSSRGQAAREIAAAARYSSCWR
jgi:hypothetical protein